MTSSGSSHKSRLLLAALLLAVCGLYPAQGATVYVDKNVVGGSNNGTSWANAFTELSAAIPAAASGDEIWVADGTYKPTNGVDRTISFVITNKSLSFYGGFQGNNRPGGAETLRSQRNSDPAVNDMILSGEIGGFTEQDNSNNLFKIGQAAGAVINVVIDGFILEDCYNAPGTGGCIVLDRSGGLNLQNCIVRSNIAGSSAAIRDIELPFAGAMRTFTDCTFLGNQSTIGYPIFLFAPLEAPGVFTRCRFQENQSTLSGAGVGFLDNHNLSSFSRFEFTDCSFVNNIGTGAPGCFLTNCDLAMRGCDFSGNQANGGGWGGAIDASFGDLTLIKCVFNRNSAGGAGGAIVAGRELRVYNTTFNGNVAGEGGGAVYIEDLGTSDSKFVNCSFAGNLASGTTGGDQGGGAILTTSDIGQIDISWCTFAGNVTNSTTQGGAAFRNSGVSDITVDNSIIWGNSAGGDESLNSQIRIDVPAQASITYSNNCIQNGPTTNGNFNQDPQFLAEPDDGGDGFGNVNDDYGNLTVSPTSPCLDRLPASSLPLDEGDVDGDSNTTEVLPLDVAGFAREVDIPTLSNGSGPIDVGAYELIEGEIRYWGQELEAPAGVDSATEVTPTFDNQSVAFVHPFDGKVIGKNVGVVNVTWGLNGFPDPSTTLRYLVLAAPHTVSVYRTDSPNNGPLVDLSSIIDNNGQVIVHYNNVIQPDSDPIPPDNSDIYVDTSLKKLFAKKAGSVLLEYRDAQTEENLGYEVVQIRNRIPVVQEIFVGQEVGPANPGNVNLNIPPVVTVGLSNGYAYQQTLPGPTQHKVFSIRPNTSSLNFEVYWFKSSLFDIVWPIELTRYRSAWPNDPQINLQSSNPKVSLGAHELVVIDYKDPDNHATLANKEFITSGNGMATLRYQNMGQTGTTVSFEVVRTVDSRDSSEGFPIMETAHIGDRIESASHDLTCFSSGYIKTGTNYDPSIYSYPNAGSTIIPVNEGSLEVWFYETSQRVCWPFRSVLYNCVWPTVADHCLTISNQKGVGPFNDAVYLNPSIYSAGSVDSTPVAVGDNPNEEHAQWATSPGGTLFAAREDLNAIHNRSDPYVLLKYRDNLTTGQPWEMDVIQVRRTGSSSPGTCVCDREPCDFIYDVTAGTALQAPLPLGLPVNIPLCDENMISNPEYQWDDQRGNRWFRRGGISATAEYYERWEGDCSPWLDNGTDDPQDVTWNVDWPKTPQSSLPPGGGGVPIKDVYIDFSFGETIVRDLSTGVRQAEILYNEAGAVLIRPWKPSFVSLAELPTDYLSYRRFLPPDVQARIDYDIVNQLLIFNGIADQGLLGIMSVQERDKIKDVFNQAHHAAFRTAIDALYAASQQTGTSAVGTIVGPDNPAWGIAISAGRSDMQGWVVLGYNGDPLISEVADVEVFNVGCPPDAGSLLIVEPDCVFDEQLTVRWSGDCGGDCSDLEFKWEFAVGDNPSDFEDIDPSANPNDPPPFNPWQNWTHEDGSSDWQRGKNVIVISGQTSNPLFVLTDNWFRVKVRIPMNAVPSEYACPPGTESDYTDPQLAEGWIKRVKRALNPFDQRVRQFTQSRVATYVSMIEQLGTPYVDRVGLTCDPETINKLGLIELYQGVLQRGRSFTIDQGLDYGPANQALILMAGALADFYMLLGNEAYGDALDPTLILTPDLQSESTSIFSFQDQLPTNQNSLLYEELTLLRGRDDRGGTPIDRFPVFNKLFWNFTSGDGQIAYVNNYNIQDRYPLNPDGSRGDGFLDENDARTMFPQGHGDAYGHYMTALRFYYELLRHDSFTWEPRSESVLVDQVPVEVNYSHERKMARAAAAKARCAASIMDLTYRERYTEDPSQQTQGYPDPVEGRNWGLTDWGRRSFIGAYFDWATSNANIPSKDDDPSRIGTVRQVDRTTVPDLAQIVVQAQTIQNTVDQADAGLNPLGLAKNVVPFDLQPFDEAGRTHFEQVFDRAHPAVVNAVQVFRFASQASQSLRENQDEAQDFENNIENQEFDFDSRLIEVFGTPYPQDVNPLTGNTYGPSFKGPDLYHWMYVDVGDIAGFVLPSANETLDINYNDPEVNDEGVISATVTNATVTFNVVPGFGIVKPAAFTLNRVSPGEIQLAQSDLIQAQFAFRQGLKEYGTAISNIEDFAKHIETISGIRDDQIELLNVNIGLTATFNSLIIISRGLETGFKAVAIQADTFRKITIDSIPKVVGLSNDVTAPLRGAIRATGESVKNAFEILADAQEAIQVGIEQSKELTDKGTDLSIQIKENQIEYEGMLLELQQMVRDLAAKEIELYTLQEALNQASMRYLATINKGFRIIEERSAFRQATAEKVSRARYHDMAFRIFRNDALQKYRAQFDLAARFVYLAAKAYGYETNLLEFSPLSGEGLLERISKVRTIGEFDDTAATAGGLPFRAGSGLSGIMAELDSNFRALKPVLGFNNPTISTDKFSLRSDYNQIADATAGESVWKEYLRRHTVEDLRTEVPEFNQFLTSFAPYRSFNPSAPVGTTGEPGIVIDFPTTIQADLNFFNKPPLLTGGDSFFPSDHFSIKIKGLGVWFSDYSPQNGLTSTPRCYLVPVGVDQIRIPGSQNLGSIRKVREWRVVDSIIPPPFDLGEEVFGQRLNGWIPSEQLPGTLLEPRLRRNASIRAYADGGEDLGDIDESEFITTSSLVGRSVWNSKWMLIIPGRFLQQSDPKQGIDRFIDTVSDIRLAFETYQFSGSKRKQSIEVGVESE